MNPIDDQKNVYDWQKYMYQESTELVSHYRNAPTKPFDINASEKTKKDVKKEKEQKKKSK